MLRICSPQLGISPNSFLGGEVHDYHIINQLAKKGNQVFVYLPKNREYVENKNLIVEFAPIKHILAITFNLLEIPYLFRVHKKYKFKILRVHSPYYTGLGALLFKLFHPEVLVVANYHLVETNILFDMINRFTADKYDGLIVVSKYLKEWLKSRYEIEGKKIKVIYNGVDDNFKPSAKDRLLVKKHNLQGKVVILFMGLLIERKNPLFLLKVYQKLKKRYKNIALVFCGTGDQEAGLKSYTLQNNLKDVIFAGIVSGPEKIKYYNLCDIFALPSLNEGFGLVIAEAMACSKPVVITNGWSAKEAVMDGVNGLLADYNSHLDWSEKLELLIKDAKLRRDIGSIAYKSAKQRFSWQKASNEYMGFYNQLLKKK